MSVNESGERTKVVTVFAAASTCVADVYKEDAFHLGKLIGEEGWVQVNGGSFSGLMGEATRGAFSVGGIVDCVILDKFAAVNLSDGFRNVGITSTLADRKAGLAARADAFVALPGGLGTLDELADELCMRQLSFHEKPIAVVNTNGYYNHLQSFLQHSIREKFIVEALKNAVYFADTPADALKFLKTHKPVKIDKEALLSGEMKGTAAET